MVRDYAVSSLLVFLNYGVNTFLFVGQGFAPGSILSSLLMVATKAAKSTCWFDSFCASIITLIRYNWNFSIICLIMNHEHKNKC